MSASELLFLLVTMMALGALSVALTLVGVAWLIARSVRLPISCGSPLSDASSSKSLSASDSSGAGDSAAPRRDAPELPALPREASAEQIEAQLAAGYRYRLELEDELQAASTRRVLDRGSLTGCRFCDRARRAIARTIKGPFGL